MTTYRISIEEAMRLLNYSDEGALRSGFSKGEFETLKRAIADSTVKGGREE